MREWAIIATFTGMVSERDAIRLEDELGGEATVANVPSAGQFTVTMHVEGESPVEAAGDVMRHLNPQTGGRELLALETVDEAEYERRAGRW